ncbi:translation elongation factor Ts [Vagococcus sp. BWB3-3]|uniref:Elongation factor Ts n=1 Tax=Vagococcus allomyrinae TaxID=2794353 RepID=A0A940SX62_9ENTE|nr:translation elongation factor Ts [Vagococcus allomyrinae]MBP1042926.1 translation elongation factor Ts [Vagococcus allomyrinae]
MIINWKDVKYLRELTHQGMLECKNALKEANNDIEVARKLLNVRSTEGNEKEARVASETRIFMSVDRFSSSGVMVEAACETDFVANNRHFVAFFDTLMELIYQTTVTSVSELLLEPWNGSDKIKDELNRLQHKLGEKIEISRFDRVEKQPFHSVYGYVHDDYLTKGKKGALLVVKQTSIEPTSDLAFNALIHKIVMQIVATEVKYVSREEVPKKVRAACENQFEEEVSVMAVEAKTKAKIVANKLEKYYKQNCLLEQDFIFSEEGMSILDVLATVGKQPLLLKRFVKY